MILKSDAKLEENCLVVRIWCILTQALESSSTQKSQTFVL